ncbi:MAG TPA: DUF6295 family protein [Acidimicrobiales bacterium]|jgi:hypothetical protein|nr:DUF6295 family protein [Acidimicrobiales bacterium]
MCTYSTERAAIEGSGKGAGGWFDVNEVLAYFDHPYHSHEEHTLNLDFVNASKGPSARIALELTADSARDLVRCIEAALAAAGPLLETPSS